MQLRQGHALIGHDCRAFTRPLVWLSDALLSAHFTEPLAQWLYYKTRLGAQPNQALDANACPRTTPAQMPFLRLQ